jgi:hypothetical protein
MMGITLEKGKRGIIMMFQLLRKGKYFSGRNPFGGITI